MWLLKRYRGPAGNARAQPWTVAPWKYLDSRKSNGLSEMSTHSCGSGRWVRSLGHGLRNHTLTPTGARLIHPVRKPVDVVDWAWSFKSLGRAVWHILGKKQGCVLLVNSHSQSRSCTHHHTRKGPPPCLAGACKQCFPHSRAHAVLARALVLEKGGDEPGALMGRLCRMIAAVMSDSCVNTTACLDGCKLQVLHTCFRVTRGGSKADEQTRGMCVLHNAQRDQGPRPSRPLALCFLRC